MQDLLVGKWNIRRLEIPLTYLGTEYMMILKTAVVVPV